MKIVTVIGARPQFVKAAPLSRLILKQYSAKISEIIVHTGQHYDANMSDIFFEELEIPKPAYHLGVGSGSHGVQTGKMLAEIEKVLQMESPDLLIIYGDTNSTLAGALAAAKIHIPIAHIEAGLRSFNMLMPEEQNRIIADHLSSLLFCPAETAIRNLAKENIYDGKILKNSMKKPVLVKNVGDIMFDAVLFNSKISDAKSSILKNLQLTGDGYVLTTIHRQENTDDPEKLRSIFAALGKIDSPVVIALHPRTKKFIGQYGIKLSGNLLIIEPVGYLDMIQLEKNSKMIITDSGGVQKEAYFFKKPCITLRDETEWVETVDAGWNYLAEISEEVIIRKYQEIKSRDFSGMEYHPLYGDGNASERILSFITASFDRD